MEDEQFWTLILTIVSLGLLMVNFFRSNLLFTLAGVFVNIGLALQPGVPSWLRVSALLLAVGEAVVFLVRVMMGRKKDKKRWVG